MNIWPAAVAFAIIFCSAHWSARRLGAPSAEGRFASLDGLRGYLAFGVFVCHGSVWYYFLRTGVWANPPSRLYRNLGQVSVILFFMLTGFLFWTKLLQGRARPINWYRLYLSRFLRLLPLYAFALSLLLLTVAILTGFHLREHAGILSRNALRWGSFTVLGEPDLNGFARTSLIVAGVTWTLRYEWLFYCALPLFAVVVGVATPRRFVLGGVLIVGWLFYRVHPEWIFLVAFAGGALAASVVHYDWSPSAIRGPLASVAAAALLVAALGSSPTAYALLPLALLTVAFTIIAAGNTLFGVLAWPASRFLGQLTYSIYLLHGIVLFWVFRFLVGFPAAASCTPAEHWLIVWLTIPVVMAVCYATFRWVELPGMRSISHFRRWLHPA